MKFTTGQNLSTRSICDHNCIFTATVLSRTEKTVTVKTPEGVKRCKVHVRDDHEFIFPFGQYSMAPRFTAGSL